MAWGSDDSMDKNMSGRNIGWGFMPQAKQEFSLAQKDDKSAEKAKKTVHNSKINDEKPK